MSQPALQVIIGATRPGRVGPKIAAWFYDVATRHGGFDVELVDLADVGLPLLDEPENPARGGTYFHPHTKAWSATVKRADCLVFVVPEYNNSFNAATKNAIDYLYQEWRDKPVGMVSYGGNVGAGTRAVQALKHVFLAVKAMPVHESVSIPFVYRMLDDDGGFTGGEVFEAAAMTMLDELGRRYLASPARRRTERRSPRRSASAPHDNLRDHGRLDCMTSWSLLTARVEGRFAAAVRRADATIVIPAQLRGYDGLAAVLGDWDEVAPVLRKLDPEALPAEAGAVPVAPIRYPPKLIGVGPNYHDHVAEMGAPPVPPAAAPFFYFVPSTTTVIGDGEPVLIPADPAAAVDWEAELAVIIGRGGRDIAGEDALAHIAGYACFNDITARGLMRKADPLADPFTWDWASAKGLDTFCPLGPVKPAWFVPDPGALAIRCLVNGTVKQDSSTMKLIRKVPELVAEASQFWSLEPGDVIATGTPAGVGHPRGEHLSDGDDVRVEITGLAPLHNPVRVRTPRLGVSS